MNTYSIEIAHIYQDMELDNTYLSILKKSISNLNGIAGTKVIKILVDDFNIKEKKWEIEEFISFLKSNNISVDFVAFESKFSFVAENLISSLDENLLFWENDNDSNRKILYLKKGRKKIRLKILENNNTKHTCVLLSACWQFCRLGFYEYPINSYIKINKEDKKSKKSKKSDFIYNIIDIKYKNVESSVNIILKEFNLDKNVLNIYI